MDVESSWQLQVQYAEIAIKRIDEGCYEEFWIT